METSISAALWEQAQITQHRLTLDLRGTVFTLDRQTLINLPENILLCLFPQGVEPLSPEPPVGEDEEYTDVFYSDFDPACFSYVLAFFQSAQDDFYGAEDGARRYRQSAQRMFPDPFYTPTGQSPLLSRQAVIVLREEMEYYPVPVPRPTPETSLPPLHPIDFSHPTAHQELAALTAAYEPDPALETTNFVTGQPTRKLLDLKEQAGQALLQRRHIFTALQRNVNKENNVAEQHLIDMLCMSGFDRSDDWGYRALEPTRCSMVSLALVLLKTGTVHAADTEVIAAIDAKPPATNQYVTGPYGSRIDEAQLATAQKLLLFWRKPARKCWWDGVDVIVPVAEGEAADPPPDEGSDEGRNLATALREDHSAPRGPGARTGSTSVPGSEASHTAGMTKGEVELWKAGKGRRVRVWSRRIWTLELSLL